MDCPICCLSFTQSKRKCITCQFCSKNACTQCWETYLPTVALQQPKCMHCDAPWSDEFISQQFTRAFREGPMKRAREDHLLSLEEAMLPGTQEYARLARRIENEKQAKQDMTKELNQIRLSTAPDKEMLRRMRYLQIRIHHAGKDIQNWHKLIYNEDYANDIENPAKKEKESVGFLHKCPVGSCNGFLGAKNYKCGLCSTTVCQDCLEPKTEGHKCNPDTVATVKIMKKDSKPCPKCGSMIHKIDGCDQMWCVECKTAFSWNTGKIETGRIHNPHWYEWQRLHGNGDRDAQFYNGPCRGQRGAYPDYMLMRESRYRISSTASNAHRCLVHLSEITIPSLQNPNITEKTNIDLRISYLLGLTDKNAWKQKLCIRDKKRQLDGSLRQILDTFVTVAGEILWRYCDEDKSVFPSARAKKELISIKNYTNECVSAAMVRFGSKRHIEITEAFDIRS